MSLNTPDHFHRPDRGLHLPQGTAVVFATWLLLVQALAVAAGDLAPLTGFLAGADFSHVALFESRGEVYRDGGQTREPLTLLRERGLSCARLRLFTSSAAQAASDPYNYVNNLDYTLPLAKRTRQAGLRFMLDLHYSDTWADPGHQTKPAAWTNLTFAQLEQRIYEYSRDTIAAFSQAGAPPDFVQVGNEITGGLLWPDGRVGGTYDNPGQWVNLGRLFKAAVRGVREAGGSAPPRVILHIDRGGDWAGAQWFLDKLTAQNVDYDIIGLSYYPFWHGALPALKQCLTNAAQRYAKPVLIAETAFPWVTTNRDGTPISTNLTAGFPPGTNGQVQFAAELARILQAIPAGRGLGIVWWGSEYQPVAGMNLAGFENRSFFDYSGNALPVIEGLGRWTRPVIGPPQRGGGNSLRLAVPGPAGFSYEIQASSNLAHWLTAAMITNPAGTGSVTFPATEVPGQFFRVRPF